MAYNNLSAAPDPLDTDKHNDDAKGDPAVVTPAPKP